MGLFSKSAKSRFLEFSPHVSKWSIVSWNFDLTKLQERSWVIETHKSTQEVICWRKDKIEWIDFFKNNSLKKRHLVSTDRDELKSMMNLTIHSTLKSNLESHHDFLVTPVVGATGLDIQNETRALQWIQASFTTLMGSLDRFENDKSLILTSTFFSGITPETQENVLRLIIFNLDIFYYFRIDSSLEIAIFDDKNLGHGESKQPVFHQIIKVTKPQFYDEISKLIHKIGIVGEIT